MADSNGRGRSLLATVVGFVIVVLLAYWLLGVVIGVVVWLVRTLIAIALIVGLIALYLKLKTPKNA